MASQSHYIGTKDGRKAIKALETSVDGKKRTGWEIKPRALDIIWGGDPRYWRIPVSDEGEAELLQVCWLEVSGWLELKDMEPGNYKVTFTVNMKSDAFGWSESPVYLMAKVGTNKFIWKSANLNTLEAGKDKTIPQDLQFTVKDEDKRAGGRVNFGLYEIWRGRWKGGLIIKDVKIIPF